MSTDYQRIHGELLWLDSWSWRMPSVHSRQIWWDTSRTAYPPIPTEAPAIVWNPMVATSNIGPQLLHRKRVVVADLLDDWSIHFAFAPIRSQVESAYRTLFEHAKAVYANSEGTLELAHRFGRTDAVLMPNGVDPHRFSTESLATGPLSVGYVGKIGKRLDFDLIHRVALQLPEVSFVLAGPVLDREYRPLGHLPNVRMVGDVAYEDVPALLRTFDIGWVPHRVGPGEVGGDVIKIYEYRAAGLPVLTTPIIGAASRGLSSVNVMPPSEHASWIAGLDGRRVPRQAETIPAHHTWEDKATKLMQALGVHVS